MAFGNRIVVSEPAYGRRKEFYVKSGQTWYPGMVIERDASAALISGTPQGKIYAPGTDGAISGALWVVEEDIKKGTTTADSYAAGELAPCYSPLPGDELNLLYKNLTGTGDDHALGELGLVDDASGKIIADTGSPANKVCKLLEVITDPTADTLALVEWSGR